MKRKTSANTAHQYPLAGKLSGDDRKVNDRANQVYAIDRPVHGWYRFVLSFPPHLVRNYVKRFQLSPRHTVLDPFCGTGTTLVECKKLGIPSIGIEANPMAWLASTTKVDWTPDPNELSEHANHIAQHALRRMSEAGITDDSVFLSNGHSANTEALLELPDDMMELLLTNSISPLPLHKTLVLIETIRRFRNDTFFNHEVVALAKALVTTIGNLHFGPEVGVGPAKADAPVVPAWLEQVEAICSDLRTIGQSDASANVHLADSRHLVEVLDPKSIDAVFTSPPYPNEKDYTRTTRLESVLLGLIADKSDLKALKRGLIRSNTRGVTVEDNDDEWIAHNDEVRRIAEQIEERRISMGKTSGFERLYARVTKLYFGGMARHLAELRTVLKPGARLGYVVGDQASYLRVMIRTGQILGDLAKELGYELEGIDLFRTRLATATKEQLREEVVVLRWPGARTSHVASQIIITNEKNQMPTKNRYEQIIERIFFDKYVNGAVEVSFTREDITAAAESLQLKLPKNLGDVIYSFRYRTALPESVRAKAPANTDWIIRPAGTARYRFVAVTAGSTHITPNPLQTVTKIPDATPGLIAKHALSDEQSLLAKVRYNRLVDIFTGVTCYSLQNHLRTTVPSLGQIETDEIYIGVDKRGVQYVFPVQAKGGRDQLNIVQIEQDFALCADKFPSLICQPIAAQFIEDNLIALFAFTMDDTGISLVAERHYKLVPPDSVTAEDLQNYSTRPVE